jgi:predicted 3-demethylubiquinone-9 3-methyltransferase (glyoxalase superfamily)
MATIRPRVAVFHIHSLNHDWETPSSLYQTASDIVPCLWFDGNAEEAGKFYASVFPNSHVDAVHRAPSDYPSGKTGDVLLVEFTLMGQPFTGLNGGPQFHFNEAISFQIPVETQTEADRFADALSAVPEAEQCGWVKDRFGVWWQMFPGSLSGCSVMPIALGQSGRSTR